MSKTSEDIINKQIQDNQESLSACEQALRDHEQEAEKYFYESRKNMDEIEELAALYPEGPVAKFLHTQLSTRAQLDDKMVLLLQEERQHLEARKKNLIEQEVNLYEERRKNVMNIQNQVK